jgi:hypothetical protein
VSDANSWADSKMDRRMYETTQGTRMDTSSREALCSVFHHEGPVLYLLGERDGGL